MTADTYIITKESLEIPEGVTFEVKNGIYRIYIKMDYRDMMDFLEFCKISDDLSYVNHSNFFPLTNLIDKLGVKNYVIDFNYDLGWGKDGEFIIPVVNGKIIRKNISYDESEPLTFSYAYELVGIDKEDFYNQ